MDLGSSPLVRSHGMSIVLSHAIRLDGQWIFAQHVSPPSGRIRKNGEEARTSSLIKDVLDMKGKRVLMLATIAVVLATLGGGAFSAHDKYTLQVQNGLALSNSWDTKKGRLSLSVRAKS